MGTKPKVEDWMWKAVNDIADLQDKRLSAAFHIRAEVAVEMMAEIIARHYAPIAAAHAAEVERWIADYTSASALLHGANGSIVQKDMALMSLAGRVKRLEEFVVWLRDEYHGHIGQDAYDTPEHCDLCGRIAALEAQ